MRRIVVLGCGFGGFQAARDLQDALSSRRRVQLTVVSDHSHFLYTPLLPNVATGELDIEHITFPIRDEFDESTELVIDRVEEIDVDRRALRGQKRDVGFDYLLVACGATTDWQEHPEWADHALSLHSARDAVRLREAIATALREAAQFSDPDAIAQRLTFVFAGGGPTGVELAAELIAALDEQQMPGVSEHLRDALRFVIVEQRGSLLPDMPTELGEHARDVLRQMGLELRLGTAVVGRDASEVALSTGEIIRADNFIWAGGVRAPSLLSDTVFELDERGRIRIEPTLQARGLPGVYAIGDAARTDAELPMYSQVASQQGPAAAKNIVAELSGRGRRAWHYQHRGDLVTLGRQHALAYTGGTLIEGRAARALYRLVHTATIPTGIRKARLFKDWLFSKGRPASATPSFLEAE